MFTRSVTMVSEITMNTPGRRRLSTDKAMGFLLIMAGSVNIIPLGKMSQEHLTLCQPGQSLELECTGGRIPLSAMWVQIPLSRFREYSTEQTDLMSTFQVNPEPLVMIRPRGEQLMLVKSLSMQLGRLPQERGLYASDVMERATIEMFLALILQAFAEEDPYCLKSERHARSQFSLDEVFRYIHTHLTEDLTLEVLEREFYVSRSHLIREFKKRTGQTVHSYIVRARLDLCRSYIEEGYSITEVYRMGGFGGYNHFFKAFRKVYGMTPKAYYHLHAMDQEA